MNFVPGVKIDADKSYILGNPAVVGAYLTIVQDLDKLVDIRKWVFYLEHQAWGPTGRGIRISKEELAGIMRVLCDMIGIESWEQLLECSLLNPMSSA